MLIQGLLSVVMRSPLHTVYTILRDKEMAYKSGAGVFSGKKTILVFVIPEYSYALNASYNHVMQNIGSV